ncbi:putative C6 transcription factor [Cadophora sp. MPI-SDFR-AT-0126]|nr:putative C6 transcription factor [Leotiomycetes sp. MPI-SDFR-AT-0126]
MPYRGKLSKACQRCRERRLKCDLLPLSCSSCIRARVVCAGYRDTQKLRIRNETNDIRKKAISRRSLPTSVGDVQHFPLSLDFQAREAFFCFHVIEASRTWDFLVKFYNPVDAPEHLTKSIDAVSLAFLSHQRSSHAALVHAREMYGSAIRMTTSALQAPEYATKYTTILSTLMLDMFEKITNMKNRHSDSWMSHISGALALVNLQGLDHYKGNDVLRVLGRLSTNLLISCIAGERPIPTELISLRKYITEQINASDGKSRLTNLMIDYGLLRTEIREGCLSVADCMDKVMELDAKLHALSINMPHQWQYRTATVEGSSARVFCQRVDIYPGRHITQTWNVLRLVRISLNVSIVKYCLELQTPSNSMCSSVEVAYENINSLVHEICASVPQYLDCSIATRLKLPAWKANASLSGTGHSHSPSHTLDCYTTILPMFAAAYSQQPGKLVRSWCVEQLRYLSNHFGIRNARSVAQILELGIKVDLWAVYSRLGSYAFVA